MAASSEETDKLLQIAYYKTAINNPRILNIPALYYLKEWLFPTRYGSNGHYTRVLEPLLLQHFFHNKTYNTAEEYMHSARVAAEINLSCKSDVQEELLQWLLTKDCSS